MSARAASAIGTAVAVWWMYRAALQSHPKIAIRVACACATTPAIVFFATVVEIHGVFLAFAGLCWYLMARHEAIGSAARLRSAFVLGVATAVAAHVHATGQLLPLVILPWWYFARPDISYRDRIRFLAVSATGHAVTCLLAVALFLAMGVPLPWRDQLHFVAGQVPAMQKAGAHDFSLLAMHALRDWLLPFAPFSVSPMIALLVRRNTGAGLVLLWGAVLYIALTWVLIDVTERGAYAVPLVWPACVLACRLLGAGWCWPAIGISATLSLAQIREHDHAPGDPHIVSDVRAACAGATPAFLTAHLPEFEWFLRETPELVVYEFGDWLLANRGSTMPNLSSLVEVFDRHLQAGHALCMGAPTAVGLFHLNETPAAKLVWQYLTTEYKVTEIAHGSFHGVLFRR